MFALTSRTPVRSLGRSRLAALSKSILLGTCHVMDEFGAPEALCGPIFVDRHHADGLKTRISEHIPAMVPVDLRLVFLRGPLRIGEPYDGVPCRLPGNRGSQGINLSLRSHERQGKRHLFSFLQIANDLDTFQGGEFAFETAR